MTSAYPLHWPAGWARTPEAQRKAHSPFTTTYDRAIRDLRNELRLLGATHVVISSHVPIRQDGQPYADAARRRIDDPGVAVYFQRAMRPMVMARDLYWNVMDNLRSIGLGVEHMRGLERHGGATMMERAFQGFLAIEPPKSWRKVLGIVGNGPLTRQEINVTYRMLARALNVSGGSEAALAELNTARDRAFEEVLS